ncbi:helix-turn-helix domain-containing protein [Liquorilactobacillus mali]|nr:helix-turn-helix transcriptional regulator [Liquorilactobacillus mali]
MTFKDSDKISKSRIINLREKNNLTQNELAEKVGINRSVLNRIENGSRHLRDDEVVKLANYFHVSTDYLLGNDRMRCENHIEAISKDSDEILKTKIINLREKNKLTQNGLAEKVGLDATIISKIENGTRKVSSSELNRFANIFSVSADYLLGNTSNRYQDEVDLKDFLDQNFNKGMSYADEELTDEDKQRLKIALTQIFWKYHNKK